MEAYINASKVVLGALQAGLKTEELERSQQAAKELYDVVKVVSDKYNLNIGEVLHTVIGVATEVTIICHEEIENDES